jgi:hypothetical protein
MVCLDACGGHGTCENGTCACDAGWTGAGDILTYETYSCTTPVLAVQLFWSVTLLGNAMLLAKLVKAIRLQEKPFARAVERAQRKGATLKRLQFPSLKILYAGVLGTVMPVTVMCVYKIVPLGNNSFGVHAAPSLAYFAAAVGTFVSVTLFETRTFAVLAKGSGMKKQDAEALVAWLSRRLWGSLGLYGLVTLVSFALGIYYGASESPLSSPMRYVLVLRNLSFAFYLASIALVSQQLATTTAKLIQTLGSQKSDDSSKAARALLFIQEASKEKRKAAIVVSVAYIAFCIAPPLLGLQTFVISFFMTVSFLTKSHYVNSFLGTSSVKVDTEEPSASSGGASQGSSVA